MNELKNYLKTSFTKSAVFDASVVAGFLEGNRRAKDFFEEYIFSGEMTPILPSYAITELFALVETKREEMDIEHWLLNVFEVHPLSYEIAKEAGILKSPSMLVGEAITAATAKVTKLPVITTMPSSYRNTGVRVFRPY